MRRAGVLGATGYTGAVLLSILLGHPDIDITLITSNTYRGKRVSDVFPFLRARLDTPLEATDDDHRGKCDVYFLCLPHGVSGRQAKSLFDGKALIIDLAADLRFEDAALYERTYGEHPAKELLRRAVYGLPELHRARLAGARLVGNPGCYPTSAILALAPLLRHGLTGGRVFIDSKSGVSGAGREAKLGNLFCEVAEGFKPYGVGVHRHEPEIQKELAKIGDVQITFVPHLLPINRGILTTVYGGLTRYVPTAELLDLYRKTYADAPFVRICDEGAWPDTRFVRYSNYCDIGLKTFEDGRFILVSTIDNLVKGASGQAIQNMNVALGIEETTGLTFLPQYP
ncbi:MAG: N-acetyl-gamma-glutamyl-phosphate reductase [Syntrophorhabdales bacterium]|jgi:N-acetyl-gamma-glutamyl-phosphate reductase